MKKLALILALAFTMGLTASTVSASAVNDDTKTKKECCTKAKDCSKEKQSSCTEKKACCSSKTTEKAPAK